MGSDTARDRLPASLTSTPYGSVIVGISSSLPATRISAATTPRLKPARTLATTCTGGGSDWVGTNDRREPTSTPAMNTSSTARTWFSVAVSNRVAQCAPTQAPSRLPASRFRTTGHQLRFIHRAGLAS